MPGYISYRYETINPEFTGKAVRIFRDETDYIEIDVVPNFSKLMGAMKEKGI
jgi:hypothetical protein